VTGLAAARGRALAGGGDLAGADPVADGGEDPLEVGVGGVGDEELDREPVGDAAEGLADHVVGAVLGPLHLEGPLEAGLEVGLAGLDRLDFGLLGFDPRRLQHLAEHLGADSEEHEEGDDGGDEDREAGRRDAREDGLGASCHGRGIEAGLDLVQVPLGLRRERLLVGEIGGVRRIRRARPDEHAAQRPRLFGDRSILGLEAPFGDAVAGVAQVLGERRVFVAGALLGAADRVVADVLVVRAERLEERRLRRFGGDGGGTQRLTVGDRSLGEGGGVVVDRRQRGAGRRDDGGAGEASDEDERHGPSQDVERTAGRGLRVAERRLHPWGIDPVATRM
jgi:hypothetical protein